MRNSQIPTAYGEPIKNPDLYEELLTVIYKHMDDMFTIEDIEGVAKHVTAIANIVGRN